MQFVIANPATGVIIQITSASDPSEVAWAVADGLIVIDAGDTDVAVLLTQYVRLSDQTLQPQQALPAFNKTTVTANGIDAVTIASGLPNPTHVTVSGPGADSFDVTDGALTLHFSLAGMYQVRLVAGPAWAISTVNITGT